MLLEFPLVQVLLLSVITKPNIYLKALLATMKPCKSRITYGTNDSVCIHMPLKPHLIVTIKINLIRQEAIHWKMETCNFSKLVW
jgi:hypothetical protein